MEDDPKKEEEKGFGPSSLALRIILAILVFITIALLLIGCGGGGSSDDEPVVCNVTNSPVLQLLSTAPSPCGQMVGALSVNASGNVTYSIDGQTFQNSGVFADLASGPYTVTAKNENGCIAEMQVTIESGISFNEAILPIIEVDCAISGCHVTGAQAPDLTVRSNIFSAATRIKNQVETRNMPRGRTLTSTEIEKIICWFNDGSPDN